MRLGFAEILKWLIQCLDKKISGLELKLRLKSTYLNYIFIYLFAKLYFYLNFKISHVNYALVFNARERE